MTKNTEFVIDQGFNIVSPKHFRYMIFVKLTSVSLKFPHSANGQNNVIGIFLLKEVTETPYWITELITLYHINYNFI